MPQGGTSWLYRALDEHPDVFMSRRKELRYWDRNLHRSIRSYAANFVEAPADAVCGEITPGYSSLPDPRLRELVRTLPDVRAIYLLRNPIERDWSAVRRQLGRLHGSDAVAELPESVVHRHLDGRRMPVGASLPTRNLARWRRHVPDDRILVLVHDDLRADPRALMRRTFDFIGVDPGHRLPDELTGSLVNANPVRPMPGSVAARLGEVYGPEIDRIEAELDRDLSEWRRPATDAAGA